MGGFYCADLAIGKADVNGETVIRIFHRSSDFIVYWARTSVDPVRESLRICYSSDYTKEIEQRKTMAPLYTLISDIELLIAGWREEKRRFWWPPSFFLAPGTNMRAEYFTWRLADATALSLLGSAPEAKSLLENSKLSVINERRSRGRYNYMTCALLAVFFIVFSVACGSWASHKLDLFIYAEDSSRAVWIYLTDLRWRMSAIGAFGAFFSVATGLRNRAIDIDLNSLNNNVDAILRITVGAISGVVMTWLIFGRMIPLDLLDGTTVGSVDPSG